MKASSRIKKAPKPGDNVTEEQVREAIEKVRAKNLYEWHDKAICTYYVEKTTGRIVGECSRMNFSDGIYHASVNGDSLGQFISQKHAHQAVERQVAKNDEDDAKAKLTHPYLFN